MSSSTTTPPASTALPGNAENIAPRRRNGRPQACEPCRKRKTACDHTLPVCLRCKRRSTTAACIYLNSPVAYARNASAQANTQSHSQPQSPTEHSIGFQAGNRPRDTILADRRTSSTSDIPKRMRPSADLFGGINDYLGETSFSAIFKENRANLDALPTPSTSHAVTPEDANLDDVFPDHIIRMGVRILDAAPDSKIGRILLGDRMSATNVTGWTRYDAWASLAGERVMKSVWDVWDPEAGIRIGDSHEKVAAFLCKNSCKPLEDEDDPEKWRDSFSGKNMRWETLGLFFVYWAHGALVSKNSDHHISLQPPPRNDARTFMLHLLECANACITICNALETSSTLFAYLLLMHSFLESMVEGDASPTIYRRHAELVAFSLSLGLHRVTDSSITLSLEWRRRIWARVFSTAQIVSSFMGRPPLLSHRYNLTALPLDLDDVDLMSDQATLANAITHLDANGWDTRGRLHGVTLSRARMMLATVMNEVMEVVLGVPTDDVLQRAHAIKQRLYAYDAQIPDVLRWDPRELLLNEDTLHKVLGVRLVGRLEYLHAHFVIERFINKRTQANAQVLLDLSREVLSITLNLFKHPDRFQNLKNDFEWLIMTHAVPASGVLCLVLLQQRVYGSDNFVTLPRAEVIQDLSVFVAFLDWVKPNAPNADLCYRIREIVGKVLNQALEPPVVESVPKTDGSGLLYNFELPDNFLGFEEFGNFDLMDTYDWVG